MVDLHKRMLTAIPKNRRSYWTEKVDKFYLRNLKPK
jgi:G:T-mismatch repair DNA endonuclease (very short patch repair protein)